MIMGKVFAALVDYNQTLAAHAGYGSDVHMPAFRPFSSEEHFNRCDGERLLVAHTYMGHVAAGMGGAVRELEPIVAFEQKA